MINPRSRSPNVSHPAYPPPANKPPAQLNCQRPENLPRRLGSGNVTGPRCIAVAAPPVVTPFARPGLGRHWAGLEDISAGNAGTATGVRCKSMQRWPAGGARLARSNSGRAMCAGLERARQRQVGGFSLIVLALGGAASCQDSNCPSGVARKRLQSAAEKAVAPCKRPAGGGLASVMTTPAAVRLLDEVLKVPGVPLLRRGRRCDLGYVIWLPASQEVVIHQRTVRPSSITYLFRDADMSRSVLGGADEALIQSTEALHSHGKHVSVG
jgi:hypothetical protein